MGEAQIQLAISCIRTPISIKHKLNLLNGENAVN